MSVITPSATVMAWLGQQSWGQQRYDVVEESDVTGDASTLAGAPPRWRVGLASARGLTLDVAGEWEALVLDLEGGINYLAVYDVLRPAPVGTLRGNPLLGADLGVGATAAVIDNAIGTIEKGDWFSIGTGLGTSQLVKATQRVVSAVSTPGTYAWTNAGPAFSWTNGGPAFTWAWPGAQITLNFKPAIRRVLAWGLPLVWDKPVGYYKMVNNTVSWAASANGPAIDGFALDLIEQWPST